MKIRTVTTFMHLEWPLKLEAIAQLGKANQDAQRKFEEAGYEVQSSRLATTPVSELIKNMDQDQAIELAVKLEKSALDAGFGYISLGPILAEDSQAFQHIEPMLASTQLSFVATSLTSAGGMIHPEAMWRSAEVIQKISRMVPNGFANLRLATLANVPAGSPFFPAAYHSGKKASFAIGTQAADLAVDAFSSASNVRLGSQSLSKEITRHGQLLGKIGKEISLKHQLAFEGIDFSLAPYPEDATSLGKAMELLGVPAVGMSGSSSAAAILTDAIQAADFPRTGFNGLFLPVLEDSILAKRAADGNLSVLDLLLYSAVCGTGLDTIPLPGDIRADQLAAILMDVATLAVRLDKPLTARLMPIPGKKAGDRTDFDFDFFANSRVMAIHSEGLNAALASQDPFTLASRKS